MAASAWRPPPCVQAARAPSPLAVDAHSWSQFSRSPRATLCRPSNGFCLGSEGGSDGDMQSAAGSQDAADVHARLATAATQTAIKDEKGAAVTDPSLLGD